MLFQPLMKPLIGFSIQSFELVFIPILRKLFFLEIFKEIIFSVFLVLENRLEIKR